LNEQLAKAYKQRAEIDAETDLILNCQNCGRTLTNPVSMHVGFGPICSAKLGVERPEYNELMSLDPKIKEDMAKIRKVRRELEKANVYYQKTKEQEKLKRKMARERRQTTWETESQKDHSAHIEGDSLIVKLRTGQFNFAKVKDDIKEVGRPRWNPDKKQWEAALSDPNTANIVKALQAFDNIKIDNSVLENAKKPQKAKQAETAKVGICSMIDGKITIRFEYGCPNFKEMLSGVKSFKAKWNPTPKYWSYPIDGEDALKFLTMIEGFNIEVPEDIKEAVSAEHAAKAEATKLSTTTDADIVIEGLGGELYPFQKAGVAYAVKKGRVLIADEMGLGKTCQGLAFLQYTNAFPAIVVCPASLKLNWQREANIWLPKRSCHVLSGTGKDNAHIPSTDIIIINYDILVPRLEALIAKNFAGIILDESHYIKNKGVSQKQGSKKKSGTQRTTAALQLGKNIPYKVCLTGTPILSKPVELITQLQFLGKLDAMGGSWKFRQRYCDARKGQFGWNFSGASDLKALNHNLRATCMVRRRKQDVLKELPDKQRTYIPVEIDNRDEYEEASNNFLSWLSEQGNLPEGVRAASYPEQLVKIGKLKQLAARGKLKLATEWIKDFLDTGEKLVIFAHHKEIIASLTHDFENSVSLVGDTPMQERQAVVDRFQNDPECKLFIGSMKAAGVGITLTAASNVVFLEFGWSPSDHEQNEDRLHRIGQENSVMAWYFLARNTIDEDIHDLILSKRAIVNMTTNGTTETNVVEKLVERLKRK